MATDTLWLSPTDFVTGDTSLTLSYPSITPSALVKATTPGGLKWIHMGVNVPLYHEIQAIHVCYQVSNGRTFISEVQLVEMQTPDRSVRRHRDTTDLQSTSPTSYRSALVAALRPGAAVSLALGLKFGNAADTITLGAIGLEVISHGVESVIRPEDFGAVGDGEQDDGPAIQAALAASWAAKAPLHLYAKTYATAQEIDIPPGKHTTIIGTRAVGDRSSTFKAIPPPPMRAAIVPPQPMRAVLSIATDGAQLAIENLGIDGNNHALVGIYGQNCSFGTFRSVRVGNCLRDGICFVGENDSEHYTSGSLTLEMLRYLRCDNTWVKESMYRPQSGVTCSVLANGVITFQGAIKLNTLGLSVDPNAPANVIVKKGKEIARCKLISVDSESQITVAPELPFPGAVGCDFSLSNFKHSINDTNSFFDCSGGSNGHMWNTLGTHNYRVLPHQQKDMSGSRVAVDIGSDKSGSVVTFSGGDIDLYALKLRQGDGIRVGTNRWVRGEDHSSRDVRRTNDGNIYRVITPGKSAGSGGPTGTGSNITDGTVQWEYAGVATADLHGMIASIISPTELEATFKAEHEFSGLDFEIASGDGYHECPSSDNNINSFQGTSLWRGNANCHFAFSGLYGPLLVGQQMDYAGMYSIRVGQGGPVLTPLFLRNYSEDSGSGKMFFLWSTQGCAIHTPVDQGGKPDKNIDYPWNQRSGSVTGVYYNRNGIFELGTEGFYSTNLYAENLGSPPGSNPKVHGLMLLSGGQLEPDSRVTAAPFSINGTTTFTQHCNVLHPYDRDYILTGTPTFALAGRVTLILLSIEQNATGRVTLQDDKFLEGTKLRLSGNRVSLGPANSMLLYCDGVFWYEIGRTPPVNQTRCVGRRGTITPGVIVAGVYVAAAPSALKAENVAPASANGAGTLSNPIGACVGFPKFPDWHFDIQSSGEMHVPDRVWVGGVPAVTDVGKPVYLAEAVGAWTMTAPTSSGSTVVRMGTITVGGARLVMVLIKIGDPRVNP